MLFFHLCLVQFCKINTSLLRPLLINKLQLTAQRKRFARKIRFKLKLVDRKYERCARASVMWSRVVLTR